MKTNKEIKLDPSWKQHLGGEFEKPYMKDLRSFLKHQYELGKKVYPSGSQIFNALNTTHFDQVRVVILGQDPYHGPGQAHGLSFSVPDGVPFPPSLQNIFKELESDLGVPRPKSGNLQHWADQGVLLLNSVLTVEEGQAASHQKKGWETFTDAIIHALATEKSGLVFVLWGAYAQKKGAFIDRKKHLVLRSVHPSPLSVHRGFYGSKPFSQINTYLVKKGQKPIDWNRLD